MSLICADWTHLLNGMFAEVQHEVGLGRRRCAYRSACSIWLRRHGIPHSCRPSVRLMLGSAVVTSLSPDFIVWNSVVVCLKSVSRRLIEADQGHLFDLMKACQCRVGLLVNMGLDEVEKYRFFFNQTECGFEENWDYWNDIQGRNRQCGLAIRSAIRDVFSWHRTGYRNAICEKLITASLAQQKLNYVFRPSAGAYFRGVQLDQDRLDCFLVENRIVVAVTSRSDNSDIYFGVNRTLSFMRSLGVEWGIAVNFGKDQVRLIGLRNH